MTEKQPDVSQYVLERFYSAQDVDDHDRNNRSNSSSSRRAMIMKQTRQIDRQIEDVQASVALLRSRSSSASLSTTYQLAGDHDGSSRRVEDNGEVEELRRLIAAQAAELESLRLERLEMQQTLDAMENETLPGYDDVLL